MCASPSNKKNPKRQYGCVQYEPQLTNETDEEVMKCRQEFLIQEYKKTQRDLVLVKKVMNETYSLQQRSINNNSVSAALDLFLDEEYLIFDHFEKLMGFRVDTTFVRSVGEKAPNYYKFIQLKSHNSNIKAVLADIEQSNASKQDGILLLILAYLRDERDQLVCLLKVLSLYGISLVT